ncbi:MAG: Tad domain-containing protein, partial [Armatimonadetes bacterium]|nr:Tad domain-containing protein [Armatimonadota bacterium]
MLAQLNRCVTSRGQTLVVIAFSLIVTLLFAGLAIDGSNAYQQRRRMQNAADAGAMAGARDIAKGGKTNGQILTDV